MTRKQQSKQNQLVAEPPVALCWLKASYQFHTYAYRDPRSAFSSGVGLPVVSPTTVLLGIVSTLYRLGLATEAQQVFDVAHQCKVVVDAPDGVIFFRAFHQVRRYETNKYGPNVRIGLTNINQATKEYGLVEGLLTVYFAGPKQICEPARNGLQNLTHVGTHDSLCALIGDVRNCAEPENVIYMPREELGQRIHESGIQALGSGVTVVTLSRFKGDPIRRLFAHWHLTGGEDTELVSYVIPGFFKGTTRGKTYRKKNSTLA